jgi:hypothetical protein
VASAPIRRWGWRHTSSPKLHPAPLNPLEHRKESAFRRAELWVPPLDTGELYPDMTLPIDKAK